MRKLAQPCALVARRAAPTRQSRAPTYIQIKYESAAVRDDLFNSVRRRWRRRRRKWLMTAKYLCRRSCCCRCRKHGAFLAATAALAASVWPLWPARLDPTLQRLPPPASRLFVGLIERNRSRLLPPPPGRKSLFLALACSTRWI